MTALAKIAPEYLLFGGAILLTLLAFTTLILVPALSSYGRTWEKATAAFLSLFVLLALVVLGIAAGALVVYNWSEINELLKDIGKLFGALAPGLG